jgi:hypothetical protein
MAEEQLVFAYCNGRLFSFERAQAHSPSVFGGPIKAELFGIEHGPRPLHMIASLSSEHLPALGSHQMPDLPLIYGMSYDGCSVDYRIDVGPKVELRKLSPTQSSNDWPYPNYPLLLPRVPLRIGETRKCSYPEFAQAFSNMPKLQPTELVVAVPSPTTLGASLWGEGGDFVTILFECDLSDRIVYASNICG